MKLTKRIQKYLVLLYSLIELDGESTKKNTLEHIQKKGYWYKNDQNDILLSTRKEKTWRNDFSYERYHLIEEGYMANGIAGIWKITPKGEAYLFSLIENLENIPFDSTMCFTAIFYHKIFHTEIKSELEADEILLDELAQISETEDESSCVLSNKPIPKGPVSNKTGRKNTYLRASTISWHALTRANHRCEIETTHPSFLRKNGTCLYMEPHHLIPMSMTEHFDVSLDREQNIFSLCSNCHNQIHYGTKEDKKRLITKLFLSREKEICSILGRNITLEELYQIYEVS